MVTHPQGYVSPGHGAKAAYNGQRLHMAAHSPAAAGTPMTLSAVPAASAGATAYCPMLAIDISAFSGRGEDVQRFLRKAMYEMLAGAFDRSGLTWVACHREDRGDGVLVVTPPATPVTALIDPLVDHLRAGLRFHNKICNDLAQIRLRMSVNAGQVHFDGNGVGGFAVTHLFRMLDAAAFKRAFAASSADFALVTSDNLYEAVISQGPGLIDPDMYAPLNIRCKETRSKVWLYLPPVRNPVLGSVTSRRPASGPEPAPPPHVAGTPLPVPSPRLPQPPDALKDRVPALAGLIAAGAATRSRWLASSASVPGRFRDRHPGQRAQRLGLQ